MRVPIAASSTGGVVVSGGGYIPLRDRRGKAKAWAVVDLADAQRLLGRRWYLNRAGYVVRNEPKPGGGQWTLGLHRAVMGLGYGDEMHVDHIDHDLLNNRRSNLRLCTHAENCQNRPTYGDGGSTSRYRGVCYAGRVATRPWQAYGWNGTLKHLGYFASEDEAAEVARAWRRKHMPFAVD